jgi:ABC-type lipoprotein release transport system permease subunit
VNGAPPAEIFSDVFGVSPGWLETMKIPLVSGRDFPADDVAGVIVNQAFEKQYFEGADAVGRAFERVDANGVRKSFTIVGSVRDARHRDNLRILIRPTFYVKLAEEFGRATFVVRTSSQDPLALAAALRQEVPRARPEFRVSNIRTQNEITESKTIRERLLATLAMFFAAVALLLAGVGLYGVLDYSVLQQRREIGIRLAIGARAAHITQHVTLPVFSMVLAGAVAGLGLGMGSVRFIESLLYQARATDLWMLALPCFAILGSAVLAALPAVLRALRLDPVAMLRAE